MKQAYYTPNSRTLFNVEVNPDKTQQRSVACSERFDATEEPSVSSLSISYSKGRLAGGAGSENGFPDFACLLMIVRMQQLEVGVPRSRAPSQMM